MLTKILSITLRIKRTHRAFDFADLNRSECKFLILHSFHCTVSALNYPIDSLHHISDLTSPHLTSPTLPPPPSTSSRPLPLTPFLFLSPHPAFTSEPQARAIIKAEPPFAIMHTNEPWTAISGLTQSEAEGLPLSDSLRLHSTQVCIVHSCTVIMSYWSSQCYGQEAIHRYSVQSTVLPLLCSHFSSSHYIMFHCAVLSCPAGGADVRPGS